MTRGDWLKFPKNEQIAFIAKLADGLKQIHELIADSFCLRLGGIYQRTRRNFCRTTNRARRKSKIIEVLPAFIEENLKLVPENSPTVFMHGDVHFGNLRVSKSNGEWQISGLFDFADSRLGFHEYEFLAVGLLMIQGQGEIQREFFKAYGYAENELDETMRKRLMMLTMLYETADLRRYARRLKPEAVDFSLEKLEREIWSFVGYKKFYNCNYLSEIIFFPHDIGDGNFVLVAFEKFNFIACREFAGFFDGEIKTAASAFGETFDNVVASEPDSEFETRLARFGDDEIPPCRFEFGRR